MLQGVVKAGESEEILCEGSSKDLPGDCVSMCVLACVRVRGGLRVQVGVCACGWECACVRARVHVYVCVRGRMRVRVRVCARGRAHACVRVCVFLYIYLQHVPLHGNTTCSSVHSIHLVFFW